MARRIGFGKYPPGARSETARKGVTQKPSDDVVIDRRLIPSTGIIRPDPGGPQRIADFREPSAIRPDVAATPPSNRACDDCASGGTPRSGTGTSRRRTSGSPTANLRPFTRTELIGAHRTRSRPRRFHRHRRAGVDRFRRRHTQPSLDAQTGASDQLPPASDRQLRPKAKKRPDLKRDPAFGITVQPGRSEADRRDDRVAGA